MNHKKPNSQPNPGTDNGIVSRYREYGSPPGHGNEHFCHFIARKNSQNQAQDYNVEMVCVELNNRLWLHELPLAEGDIWIVRFCPNCGAKAEAAAK